MTALPAQSFSLPARARSIAAARFMPGVCGVLESSWSARTMRTPLCSQSGCCGSAIVQAVYGIAGRAGARSKFVEGELDSQAVAALGHLQAQVGGAEEGLVFCAVVGED